MGSGAGSMVSVVAGVVVAGRYPSGLCAIGNPTPIHSLLELSPRSNNPGMLAQLIQIAYPLSTNSLLELAPTGISISLNGVVYSLMSSTRDFDGQVSDVTILKGTAMSQADVTALYNLGSSSI